MSPYRREKKKPSYTSRGDSMRLIVVTVSLLLAFIGRTAFADSGAVIVSGTSRVAERDRALAMRMATERLRAAGWTIADKSLAPKEIEAVSACLRDVEAWPCVSKVVGRHGINRIAAVALRQDHTVSGTPELIITGRLVLADVTLVVVSTRFCEQCTDDTLSALTTELTTDLIQQAQLESGRTVLSIKSTPQGAIYTVDGVLRSATDALITIVPGRHVVTIEREGYQTETRTVEAVEGKTAEVMVTLRHLEPLGTRPRAVEKKHEVTHRSLKLPIALVAVGSTAIVGGAIALALNQDDAAQPAGEEQPRFRYNTIPAGVTSLATGVVLAGVGGYLWWKYSRDDDAGAVGSTPMVSPITGGVVLGMLGRF
jgi:PEGA domain